MQNRNELGPPSGQSQHVLLIDDCPDIHLLIEKILSAANIQLSHAYSGLEGVEKAAEAPFSLILLDHDMPDCRGLQTLRALQQNGPEPCVPVIMITGNNDQSIIASAYEHGVCDYINKPFLPIELQARVRAALKTQALMTELRQQASFDALTGLPNKTNLLERIRSSIDTARTGNAAFAVMFIDIDRFKLINDSLGHSCGDQVLQEAAQRLRMSVRESDLVSRCERDVTISRFGGDEFVILFESISTAGQAEAVSQRILEVMRRPFQLGGRTLYLSASIGIAIGNGQYVSPEEVIRDADIAMYEAKNKGRGCGQCFDETMRNRAIQRWQLDADLRQAIEQNQFQLQYQPIVNLNTGLVEGVEALVRWNHPTSGIISPLDFIPMAEDTGLIIEIGEWVTRAACLQYARWHANDASAMPDQLSINLSRQQLIHCHFPELFQEILAETGVPASNVHFELTESEMMKDLPASLQAIQALRAIGAKIDLDDFGTGYSSLACLHQLPIDVLKLDRSLISNIDQGGYFFKLVDLVIKLLADTQIQVIAEGIETLDQLFVLQRMQCQFGQGYYFAKPMNADEVQAFVRRQASQLGVLPKPNVPISPCLFADTSSLGARCT